MKIRYDESGTNFDLSGCCKSKWCILIRRYATPLLTAARARRGSACHRQPFTTASPLRYLPWGRLWFNLGVPSTVAENLFHGYKIAFGFALR